MINEGLVIKTAFDPCSFSLDQTFENVYIFIDNPLPLPTSYKNNIFSSLRHANIYSMYSFHTLFSFYVCPFCIILSLTFIFTLSLLFLSFSSTFPPFISFLFFPQRNCLIFHHVQCIIELKTFSIQEIFTGFLGIFIPPPQVYKIRAIFILLYSSVRYIYNVLYFCIQFLLRQCILLACLFVIYSWQEVQSAAFLEYSFKYWIVVFNVF